MLYLYQDNWTTIQIQYVQDQTYDLLPNIWFYISLAFFSE